MKAAIIYASSHGTTEKVAKQIQQGLGAEHAHLFNLKATKIIDLSLVVISLLAMTASAAGVFGLAYSADSSNLAALAMGQDGINLFIG